MGYPIEEAEDVTPLELFYSRNPEEMTDEELEELVALHRDERAAMLAKIRTKKPTVRKVKDALR